VLRTVVSVTALLALAGCSETDDRSFAWGYLSPAIFQPSCATSGCHSRAVGVAALDFSDPDRGYTRTAGTAWVPGDPDPDGGCIEADGRVLCPVQRALLVPHNPGQSRLINMLRARAAPRMPPDRPLSEADIELVERWILDGARRTSDLFTPPPPAPPSDGSASDGAADGGLHDADGAVDS
jgi:hypothetical protein